MAIDLIKDMPLDTYSKSTGTKSGTTTVVTDGSSSTSYYNFSSYNLVYVFPYTVNVEQVLANTGSSIYVRSLNISFFKNEDLTSLITSFNFTKDASFENITVSGVRSVRISYSSSNTLTLKELKIMGEKSINKFLFEENAVVKSYISNDWQIIGNSPATEEMFLTHGVEFDDMPTIPKEKWKELSSDAVVLAYADSNKAFVADISTVSLYDSAAKSYKGQGIVETETENLPTVRTSLIVNANHTGCTFEYSLDDGKTWYNTSIEEVQDISLQEGNQFKIRVTLPDDSATLTALSYAWA